MDLRDYREMPDEGIFDKIERRVRMRRWLRVGAVALAVAAVAVAVPLLLPWGKDEVSSAAMSVVTEAPIEEQPSSIADNERLVPTNQDIASSELQQPLESPKPRNVEPSFAPMPAQTTLSSLSEQVQPSLPPMTVRHEETSLEELIMALDEPTSADADLSSTAAKDGGAAPVTPHYDNILWAPNIISPIAEEEENREFKVKSTSAVNDFRMVVFNRGGRQVFSTNDINQGWDARHDGVLVSQGTYVWIARFRDSSGTIRQEKGTVTVVR